MPPDNSIVSVDHNNNDNDNNDNMIGEASEKYGSDVSSTSSSKEPPGNWFIELSSTEEESTSSKSGSGFPSKQQQQLYPPSNKGVPSSAATAAAALLACAFAIEKCRQKILTKVPLVMGQIPPGSNIQSIHDKLTTTTPITKSMTKSNNNSNQGNERGILDRPIVPSLFVGTNGQLASAAAVLSRGPSSSDPSVVRFSETLFSSYDGAKIHLDWEVPSVRDNDNSSSHSHSNNTTPLHNHHGLERKAAILTGTICHPTILILHGINNSSQYGYIKNLQRAMTNKGWNAVAMNFRGCAEGGRQPMVTPRSYTAAYTGDLRSTVHQLVAKMNHNSSNSNSNNNNNNSSDSKCLPLFLVGNSLGASLVTKYLGEEGLAGTLPPNVVGGISLGNPFRTRADCMSSPFGHIIGAARKANYFFQRKAMLAATPTTATQNGVHSDPSKITLKALDRALAPTMVRNGSHPPYQTTIGYGHRARPFDGSAPGDSNTNTIATEAAATATAAAAEAYWTDSCCYKQGSHVSVPLLHVLARDDSLCFGVARDYLGYSLQNPNVLVVQTRTGGHLGWWHKPSPESRSHSSSSLSSSSWLGLNSWADTMTVDFIQAVLDTNAQRDAENPSRSPTKTASIDDAYKLFAPNRIDDSIGSGSSSSISTDAGGTGASMRALPGDRDGDDSTIATHDLSVPSRSPPDTAIEPSMATTPNSSQSSRTYFRFRQVLLLEQGQHQQQQTFELIRSRL